MSSYCYKENSNFNYLLSVKTHNSVQQANSLNKINMQTLESSSLELIKSSRKRKVNIKAQELNMTAAKKR